MQHPFQCLQPIRPAVERVITAEGGQSPSHGFLLAARGPELLSVSLDGGCAATWRADDGAVLPMRGNNEGKTEDERPAKKQKTSNASSEPPNFIKLTTTSDHRHVVAVTDDKYVRVFHVEEGGNLAELSQRCMPKRPCAIAVTPDNKTILCGDKFGDVYSLPLLPDPTQSYHATAGARSEPAQPDATFKPAATTKTVHSKRNLKALANQQKQKAFAPKKEPLAFEHKLELGHVSMLTDLLYAKRNVEGKRRDCIITADRDEHIRVSRAPPQAHVIEGYCLGHDEFVSKLCRVPDSDLLLSGGGDDWIGIWDWPTCTLKTKIGIKAELKEQLTHEYANGELKARVEAIDNIAVSGLWVAPLNVNSEDIPRPIIMVACEGLPIIIAVPLSEVFSEEKMIYCFPLSGNPIDLAVVGTRTILSLDFRNGSEKRLQAFEMKAIFDTTGRCISVEQGQLDMLGIDPCVGLDTELREVNALGGDEVNGEMVDELLYGVEKLRKRAGNADGEGLEAVNDDAGQQRDGSCSTKRN